MKKRYTKPAVFSDSMKMHFLMTCSDQNASPYLWEIGDAEDPIGDPDDPDDDYKAYNLFVVDYHVNCDTTYEDAFAEVNPGADFVPLCYNGPQDNFVIHSS